MLDCDLVVLILFFFSSRRRHTRWPRDWSSDVCSSDLSSRPSAGGVACPTASRPYPDRLGSLPAHLAGEIGRASCRERALISVVVVELVMKIEKPGTFSVQVG